MNSLVLFGLVAAALVAVGCGELCTPDQWEGVEASFGGYVYHRHPGVIKEHNYVAYDAKNKRKASFINYVNNDKESKFQMVVRYDDDNDDSGKAYIVDLKKKKCWTKKIDHPFKKACIPDDSKKIHSYSLGLKGKGLEVTGYLVDKKGMEVYLAVASAGDAIIPVIENIRGHYWETSFIQGMEYADITPGIKNETIFDVPALCEESGDSMLTEYLMREHFVLAV